MSCAGRSTVAGWAEAEQAGLRLRHARAELGCGLARGRGRRRASGRADTGAGTDVRAGKRGTAWERSGRCCGLGPGDAGAEAGWEREGERKRAGGGPGAWAAQRSVELLTRGDW